MSSPSTWRRVPNNPADWFSDDELDRSRRYQHPLTRLRLLRSGLSLLVVVGFVVGELGPRLFEALSVENWVIQLAVMVLALELVALVYNVPLDWWVDLVHDKEWGLSTQTPSGFASDQTKNFLLGLVVNVALLVPLYWLIRSTDLWWLWGWLLVVVFSVVLGFLFPVVIAPIFNKFTPLDDPDLLGRIQRIADRAGVDIEGAYVADESKRSTRDNAYVAGLGATRRVVLYDTILEHPPEVVEQVVAHEVGHWRLHHLRRQIPISAALLLVVFAGLWLLGQWNALFETFGVDGLGDPASLPILLLAVQIGFGVVAVATSWVSRAFERQADVQALELLGDPDAMAEMQRRLHTKNLADLDPSWLKYMQASHPPAAERLALTQAWTSTS